MTNIEASDLQVSDINNFEVGRLWFYVSTCDPRGGARLDPWAII